MSTGIPVYKFISTNAKRNKKYENWSVEKKRKPMTYSKGHFDTVQSEAPQLVSWSFMMNLNSEFTWIDVKNNNWKLKICIFSSKWNEKKNQKGEAKALVS